MSSHEPNEPVEKTDFTGSRLTDLQVLAYADDKSFTNLCKTNLLLHKICTDPRLENELYTSRIKIHMPQFESLIGFPTVNAERDYYTLKDIYKRISGGILTRIGDAGEIILPSLALDRALNGDRLDLEILKIMGSFPNITAFIPVLGKGKLENAKFMVENGIVNPMDDLNDRNVFPVVLENDYDYDDYDETIPEHLARRGRLKELQWLAGPPFNLNMTSENIISWAVVSGSIPLLEWLVAPPWNNRIILNMLNTAAQHGYLDLLKWLANSSSNVKPNMSTANAAVNGGHIEVVKWLADSLDESGQKRNILPDFRRLSDMGYNSKFSFDILNFLADSRQLLPSRHYGYIYPELDAWMKSRGI